MPTLDMDSATREELAQELQRLRLACFHEIKRLASQLIELQQHMEHTLEQEHDKQRKFLTACHLAGRLLAAQFHYFGKESEGGQTLERRMRLAIQSHCELLMKSIAENLGDPELCKRWIADTMAQNTQRDIHILRVTGAKPVCVRTNVG